MFVRLWQESTSKGQLFRKPFFASRILHIPFQPRLTSSRTMSTQAFTESWLAGPKATQFYARTYPPSNSPTKAVVVFIHGFAEHIGRYSHFHPLLAARGIAVFAYDQRGFGLTGQDTTGKKSKTSAYGKTSWKEQMSDIDWALGHAKKSFEGVPMFLMGHSMVGLSCIYHEMQASFLIQHIGRRGSTWILHSRRE